MTATDPVLRSTTARGGFVRPGEVLASATLQPAQKRAILVQWLEDERALLVAGDEGMRSGRASQLDQVLAALRALDL